MLGKEGSYYSLMERIPGYSIGDNGSSNAQLYDSAIFYAKIVNALKNCPIDFPLFDLSKFSTAFIESVQAQFEDLIHSGDYDIQRLVTKKREILHNLIRLIDVSDFYNLSFLNSHGDYTHFQLLYDDGGRICGVLDLAKDDPVAFSLAKTIFIQSSYLIENYSSIQNTFEEQFHDYE